MQVSLKPERHYLIQTTAGELRARVVSEWEGFTKLVTEGDDIIIVSTAPGFNLEAILGGTVTATVIKASPQVFETLVPTRATEKTTAGA